MTSPAQAADAPRTTGVAAPLTLPCGQVVKNRIAKSAMSEALGTKAHTPRPGLATLYKRWADGGLGLSITGNVMVCQDALGEPGNVVIDHGVSTAGLSAWAAAAKVHQGHCYVQLNHPGRQAPAMLNPETIAPSAVPFEGPLRKNFRTPRAMTTADIERVVHAFAHAAKTCEEAGFDGVQIHGAHGYLVSQFLSPRTNQRTDAYGGNAANRRRFAEEVYRAIRAATGPRFGVAIKLNSADFQRGGITEAESADTLAALAEAGMDFVEISGGNYESPAMVSPRESTRAREAYFLAFAEAVRNRTRVPLMVTGGFRTSRGMKEALDAGIDLVGLARPLALYPDLPQRLLTEPDVQVDIAPIKTGLKALDAMQGMTEIMFYERQLHRMAKGKNPKPRASPLLTIGAHLLAQGPTSMAQRRAKG